jgi:hypothetical protein
MAYQFVLSNPTPSTVPTDGWYVGYRILGSGGSYTTSGPYMSMPITVNTADAVGTLYEGYILRDCGTLESTQYFWQTPCNCVGTGFSAAPSGLQCQRVETQPANITNSGYCLAPSQNAVYSGFGTRVYNSGFTQTTMNLNFPATDPNIFGELSISGTWANPSSNSSIGPMNREGVWIDSDCNGVANGLGNTVTSLNSLNGGNSYTDGVYNNQPLTGGSGSGITANITVSGGIVTSVTMVNTGNNYVVGNVLTASIPGGSGFSIVVASTGPQRTTVSYTYNNPGPAKTIYVGGGGDNQFQLVVNGVQLADTGTAGDKQFKIWHVMPVNVVTGPNYINIIGTGDGSVNDAVAMIVYDNTASQIMGAATEATLNIPFRSSSLRGTSFDVATCSSGFSLDVSGGAGSYTCVRTTYKPCNTLA